MPGCFVKNADSWATPRDSLIKFVWNGTQGAAFLIITYGDFYISIHKQDLEKQETDKKYSQYLYILECTVDSILKKHHSTQLS